MTDHVPDLVAHSAEEIYCPECACHMQRRVRRSGETRVSGVFVRCMNRNCFRYSKVFEVPSQIPLYAATIDWENL